MNKPQILSCGKEVLGETPVFAGTRVPVAILIDYLKSGDSLDRFLEGFPSVTHAQAIAFLDLALEAVLREVARVGAA